MMTVQTTIAAGEVDERAANEEMTSVDRVDQVDGPQAAPGSFLVEGLRVRAPRGLPAVVRRLWLIESLLGGVLLMIAALVGSRYVPAVRDADIVPIAILAVGGVALALDLLVAVPRRHSTYRFALRDTAAVITTGRVYRRELVIPYASMVYLESRQGPVKRRCHVIAIEIGTITGSHRLGPVSESTAQELIADIDQNRAQWKR